MNIEDDSLKVQTQLDQMEFYAKKEIPNIEHWLRPIVERNDNLEAMLGHRLFQISEALKIGVVVDGGVRFGLPSKFMQFFRSDGTMTDILPSVHRENWQLTVEELRNYICRAIDEWRDDLAANSVAATAAPTTDKSRRYRPPPCPRCKGKSYVRTTRRGRKYRELYCSDKECGHEWPKPYDP